MTNKEILFFFKSLRGKDLSEQEVYERLNKLCDSGNIKALEHIYHRLIPYILQEEEKFSKKYRNEDIEAAALKFKGKAPRVMYMSTITGAVKEDSHNVEAIMYPKEFKTLKFLQQYLAKRITKLGQNNIIRKNEYPEIFTCVKSYRLYMNWITCIVPNLSDYSFIYRAMYADGLILPEIGDAKFRDWLNVEFGFPIYQKTKTLKNYPNKYMMALYKALRGKHFPTKYF